MFKTIQYETFSEGYSMITLNRPEKRNAISTEMARELREAIKLAREETIKFLVITGSGDNAFCAGGDLKDLHGDLTPADAFHQLYAMKEVLFDIVSFPVPTICLLNGDAVGGGCEIATACDFRIARESTEFGFVQTKLGITPGWGGGALLYEKVHSSFAYSWLIDAEVYDALFLKDKGWVHRIVPTEKWHDRTEILAVYISKSVAQMEILDKQYKQKVGVLGLSALMDEEVRNCAKLWDSEEHVDAVNKFLAEKG
ncbi:enoyl-CoA hydratase [Virgibacillus necropolis]|uniref:Enoyl-CoA hydratase n=2 Tax=Virgibacillus necropolis TaxID=163877 RepID=A0A221MIC7_9BACI|nr:enoyl-CoA hydratase [Virgibacillus necropolis]